MVDLTVRALQLHTQAALRAELERVGADLSVTAAQMEEQVARGEFFVVRVDHASLPLARLLYQELVMEGGQVVTAPRLEHIGQGETPLLLCGTRYQLAHLAVRLRWQASEELQLLADQLMAALDRFVSRPAPLVLGSTVLDWQRTGVMGIMNLTPDSFSGDGLLAEGSPDEHLPRVLARARQLIEDGADVLDLGGESSRPGAAPVDAATESQRVLPAVRALVAEGITNLSIDTNKVEVAAAALSAGAILVNNVSGVYSPEFLQVVAAHNAGLVIMHNGRPAPSDFISDMLNTLLKSIEAAENAGIAAARILIDPGLGFGKTPEQNLEVLNRLGEFRGLGCPILIGPSRKGFISKTIGVPSDEREEGTAAAVAVGILRGANLVRVHDVRAMTRIARMTDAIASEKRKAKS